MDLSNLLYTQPSHQHATYQAEGPTSQYHHYPTRYATPAISHLVTDTGYNMPSATAGAAPLASPTKASPKPVTFVLLLPETPQLRARLPMRVNINAHDTTDSITTTVKNFYGLYDSGVSFEDNKGCTLIASYDNFEHDMTVYVRVVLEPGHTYNGYNIPKSQGAGSPRKPHLDEPFQMLPPSQYSKPTSRPPRKRSISPHQCRDRRSASVSTQSKQRARPGLKSRGSSTHGSIADVNGDAANGYSSSDGGDGSVSSSRKAKNEQLASAEISVENIVEGGRRKRAKFESSELPLFVPPQVPMTASTSSISPQRRINSGNGASPFAFSHQHTFAYPQPLPSPRSYSNGDGPYVQSRDGGGMRQTHGHRLRAREAYAPPKLSAGAKAGMPPTPDPTVGSVISDEDVALQLMRLGDASHFSSHGRTSTSTADDALSGKAEVASSNSDEEDEDGGADSLRPQYVNGGSRVVKTKHRRGYSHLPSSNSMGTSGDEYEDNKDGSFHAGSDEIMPGHHGRAGDHGKPKLSMVKSRGSVSSAKSSSKSAKPVSGKSKAKSSNGSKVPISPASMPPQSRKTSNASLTFQHPLGIDEDDLSSKPRCQRCRKSKKGCDRQRPCQRCKDAGIGIEGCVSEDEGNGRKGRYGRHMGVPVKKGSEDGFLDSGVTDNLMPALGYVPPVSESADKSKKRKR